MMPRTNKRKEKILQMLEYIRGLGFEYTISRPDRTYHILIWTVQCGRYMEVFCTGPLWKIESLIKAILMGYEVRGCRQRAQSGGEQ